MHLGWMSRLSALASVMSVVFLSNMKLSGRGLRPPRQNESMGAHADGSVAHQDLES